MSLPFRILNQAPVYFDLLGNPAMGGNLSFYAAGTTTPQDVFGDMALTVNNGPVIAIGSDGRTVVDVWGDGTTPYRVRLYQADSTLVWDRDNVIIPGGGSLSIPALVANQFLTNDGAILVWEAINQLPDPSGESGKYLSSDGTNPIWSTITFPTPNIAVATNGVGGLKGVMTDGTSGLKLMVQTGTGTIAASGINQANGTIAFPTAFSTPPVVMVTLTTTSACASGFPSGAATSIGTTGCGVSFNNSRDASSGGAITGTVTYDWIAVGLSP